MFIFIHANAATLLPDQSKVNCALPMGLSVWDMQLIHDKHWLTIQYFKIAAILSVHSAFPIVPCLLILQLCNIDRGNSRSALWNIGHEKKKVLLKILLLRYKCRRWSVYSYYSRHLFFCQVQKYILIIIRLTMGAAFSYIPKTPRSITLDRDSFVCAKVHNKVY